MKFSSISLNQNLDSLINQLRDKALFYLKKDTNNFLRIIVQIDKLLKVCQNEEQRRQSTISYYELLKCIFELCFDQRIILPNVIKMLIAQNPNPNSLPIIPNFFLSSVLQQSFSTTQTKKQRFQIPNISPSSNSKSIFIYKNNKELTFYKSKKNSNSYSNSNSISDKNSDSTNNSNSNSFSESSTNSNDKNMLDFIFNAWKMGQEVRICSNYSILSVNQSKNMFQERVKKAACGILNADGGYLLFTRSIRKNNLQPHQKLAKCKQMLQKFIYPTQFSYRQQMVTTTQFNQNQFLVGCIWLGPFSASSVYFAKIRNGYHYYRLDVNAQSHENIITPKYPEDMYSIMHNHHLAASAIEYMPLQKYSQVQSEINQKYREQILLILSSSADDYNIQLFKRRFQQIGMKSLIFSKPYTQFRNKSNKSIWVVSHDYSLDQISYEVEGTISNKKKLIALVSCKRYIIAYSVPTEVYQQFQKVFLHQFNMDLRPYTQYKTTHKDKYKDKQKDKDNFKSKQIKDYYIQFKQIIHAIFSVLYLDNERIKCIFINKTKFLNETSH